MDKAEIRIIHVPKWVTAVLLILVSAAMVLVIDRLSGHAYRREASLANLAALMRRYDAASTSSSAMLALIAPAMADILFVVPWGALAFLAIDAPQRPRRTTYLTAMTLGVAFALGLMAWQYVLPTRVTGNADAFWNAVGCAAGAALGHARKGVRVRFE